MFFFFVLYMFLSHRPTEQSWSRSTHAYKQQNKAEVALTGLSRRSRLANAGSDTE